MKYSKEEVKQYVVEEDVKFIRLAFCDVFGRQKNISIMPDELDRAFAYGIAFDASAITADTQLVAFESLADDDGMVLACHEDLGDADQSVSVCIPKASERAPVPRTGDGNDSAALRLAAASGAAIAAAATLVSIRTSAPLRRRAHKRHDGR